MPLTGQKKKKKEAKCLSARSARAGCEAELKSWWAQLTFSCSFASAPTETSNVPFDNCFWCNAPARVPRGDLISLFFFKNTKHDRKAVFVLFSDVLIGSRNSLSEGCVELASFTGSTLYSQSHFVNPPSGVYPPPPHPFNASSPPTRRESCPGFPTKVCPI